MTPDAREAAHRAASDQEGVVWVDRDDRIQGELPRAELRARGLIGRCTFILLFNAAISAPLMNSTRRSPNTPR